MHAQIHDGYPTDSMMDQKSTRESYLLRYDGATRKLVDNYYDAWPNAISKVSPGTYKFAFEIALPEANLGDLIAVRVPSCVLGFKFKGKKRGSPG